MMAELLNEVYEKIGEGVMAHISVTGSGGLLVAKWLDIPFIQEWSPGHWPWKTGFPGPTAPSNLAGKTPNHVF